MGCKKNMVGDNIRRLRIVAGFTQEELALRSGLSQGYINQLENGKRRFTQKSLELVSEALGVGLGKFFGGDDEPSLSGPQLPVIKKNPEKKDFLELLETLPDDIRERYYMMLSIEKSLL
ncbi:MAG: helix-turn-helix domain-containing protein [Deltaproteobacteria bacterium]|nr:helix-turn-helix domain-containing protein [Deltaproteobacteria bacterium]